MSNVDSGVYPNKVHDKLMKNRSWMGGFEKAMSIYIRRKITMPTIMLLEAQA